MHAGINWPTWVDHGILHYYKTSAKANKFYSSFKCCCLWWLVPQKPHSPCTLEPQIYFLNFSPSNLKKPLADLFSTKGMRIACVPSFQQFFYLQHLFSIAFLVTLILATEVHWLPIIMTILASYLGQINSLCSKCTCLGIKLNLYGILTKPFNDINGQAKLAQHILLVQGAFFNCSSKFSVPKWKTMGSQSEILFHEIFNVQKISVGWTMFFF